MVGVVKMFGPKIRGSSVSGTGAAGGNNADEMIRCVTREKLIVRGNTTIRTLDSKTSFLPIIEKR